MDENSKEIYLIPGRECGECTVCCSTLAIDDPDITKLPNVACENLLDCGGCAIYDNRPRTCDEWFCAWRNMPSLGDEWRPDKMGVLVEFARESFPEPFTGHTGFKFSILDKQKMASNRLLALFVGEQVLNGVPCILSYGGTAGEVPTIAFLNTALQEAVAARNGQGILTGLVNALEASEKIPKIRLEIKDDHLVPAED